MNWTRIDSVALGIFLQSLYGFGDDCISHYIKYWEDHKEEELIKECYKKANKLCKAIRCYESDSMNNPNSIKFK